MDKMTEILRNLKNDQNTLKLKNITDIPPKPKKLLKYPRNLKNNLNKS